MNDAKKTQSAMVGVLRALIDAVPEDRARVDEIQAQIRAIVEANGRLGSAALIFLMDETMTKTRVELDRR